MCQSHVLPDYRLEAKGATKVLELDVSTGVEPEVAGILGEFLQHRGSQSFATPGRCQEIITAFQEIAGVLNRFTRVDSRPRHESRLWMFDTLG